MKKKQHLFEMGLRIVLRCVMFHQSTATADSSISSDDCICAVGNAAADDNDGSDIVLGVLVTKTFNILSIALLLASPFKMKRH